MSTEKVNLSHATEFELRGNVTLKVYPASLETFVVLSPKLKDMDKLSKSNDIPSQMEALCDVVYELIKDDNDIKKEQLKKVLTLEAAVKIMQRALGAFGGFVAPVVK